MAVTRCRVENGRAGMEPRHYICGVDGDWEVSHGGDAVSISRKVRRGGLRVDGVILLHRAHAVPADLRAGDLRNLANVAEVVKRPEVDHVREPYLADFVVAAGALPGLVPMVSFAGTRELGL